MKVKTLRCLLVVFLLLSLTACLPGKAVKGADQEAVLAYAEPLADEVLQGIESNDYALFSQDFNDEMKSGIDEASFQDLRDLLSSKIGSYQSRKVSSVRDVNGTLLVIYTAEYSNSTSVVINFSVTGSEPHQVSGLYFTSTELRK